MRLTRREVLKSTVSASAAVSLVPAMPAFLTSPAAAATPDRDTVLVVLQLTGGNDGLNTVVPYEDDAYGRKRQTLRLGAGDIHKIDQQLGLHPELRALHRLYQDGHLTIVQGVGYAHNNRQHEGALRDWETARPGEAHCQTGWLGRTADAAVGPGLPDVPALFVGAIPRPFGLNAERAIVPAVRSAEQYRLTKDWGRSVPAANANPQTAAGNPLRERLQRASAAAAETSARVQRVLAEGRQAEYPAMELAADLRSVAQLIRADLGLRLFMVELGGGGIGGFDNHANQRDNHAALLRQLSESLAAFVRDLQQQRLFDRVVLMTFSEFGRTLTENGRRGTDHGAAQPLLMAGGKLRGGLIGRHPSLTDLDGDAPKSHTDFRSVYATLLDRWLGLDSRALLGGSFPPVPLFA